MDFNYAEKVRQLQKKVQDFMDQYIYPNEGIFYKEIERDRWNPPAIVEELKEKARTTGLW